jgi:hypothetical protein
LDVTIDFGEKFDAWLNVLVRFGPLWLVLGILAWRFPAIISAISGAIAEQRKVTHKRKEMERKIANSASQRRSSSRRAGTK